MSTNSTNSSAAIEEMDEKVANNSLSESSVGYEPIQENDKPSLISRIKTCFFRLRLEIFTCLFTFSSVLPKVTSTEMILRKVCLIHFGFNSTICDNFKNYSDIKDPIEKLSANYQLGYTLIQTAPAAVLACFIGPWSDRYGRKFPIILAICGMLLNSIGSSVVAHFLETRVEYYFIPAIFTGLSGGVVTVMALVYSYCSESSTVLARTMKYAFIEMSVGFSTSFGYTAGGWIYKAFGFAPVFLFSAGGLLLTLVFAIFVIEETRGLDIQASWSTKLRDLASCKIFLEGFEVITKHRPDRGRRQVVLLIISICFLVIDMNSTGDINYLFAQHQFGWSNTTYSNTVAIYSALGITVLVILIPLLRHFRVTDPYLGLLGTSCLLGKSLAVGLSKNVPVYHVANVIGFLGGCATFAGRSRVSKIARGDDVGKMFTFVATAENLLPILTSALMSQIFVACLSFFPGMPYLALGIFLLVPLGVFSWMLFLPKMT